jgi:DNA-binding transcriptional LysR family regulator
MALRVVAALAQHGTVSSAAVALHLTQSAVSKQLKGLEILVGMPLFRRTTHGLEPTPAGMIYIEQSRIALGAMETAALRVSSLRNSPASLRMHVLPILGDRWFISRLSAFRAEHPEIDVEFMTFASSETFSEADVVFRFGDGHWPGWRADYFLGRDVVLVGSPQALASGGGIHGTADVLRYSLLEHPQTPLSWADFMQAQGPDGARLVLPPTLRLGYYSLVIRAALGGQGLALVPRSLISEELARGDLINPMRLGYPSGNCYWLTTPDDRPRDGQLGAFCNWALAQAEHTERDKDQFVARDGRWTMRQSGPAKPVAS